MTSKFSPENICRRVRFAPYLKGPGRPTFSLTLYDGLGYTPGPYPKERLGYRLTMTVDGARTVLFEGSDIGLAPGWTTDGREAVSVCVSFLCMRPGDADPEFFEGYTAAQIAFAEEHGEALACEAIYRFGEV